MRVPCRHRFPAPAAPDELFRRLPPGRRFRFATGAGAATVFGGEPVALVAGEGAAGPRRPAPAALAADAIRAALPRVGPIRSDGLFPGGAVGFVSYERGFAVEGLPPPPATEHAIDLRFAVYDTFAVWHPVTEEVEVVSWGLSDGSFHEKTALHRATALEERLRHGVPGAGAAESSSPESRPGSPPPGSPLHPSLLRASLSAAEHARGVEAILEAIARGDIYQGNLTVRFEVPWDRDPVALFERLLRENPAPHAAFVEADDTTVISCSPERLLAVRGRDAETRPIKGTAPRDPTPGVDRALAESLLTSAKDRAELLMITDLLRNDLGKVCEYGSVQVPRLRELESFPHVHHLVSTVRGRLRSGMDALDALAAVFPGGSITGAPKRRAMEILHELEPKPRGIYTGTVGWIGFDRSCDFNVAIRTGWLRDGVFSFGAGGGIVADSDPASEWEELGWKARAFLLALGVEPDPAAIRRSGE